MKSQFSEFTYGYTLVEELSRKNSFSAIPIFPSLREEGTVGGYDAALEISGLPFFIQFKRADYLFRTNSKYHSIFNSPYYRFNLHALRHSKQHNLLLHLERSGNPVFYVAPKFHKNSELQYNYFNSSISSDSIWVAPTDIGNLPDNDEHSICFDKSETQIYFCSEPVRIEFMKKHGIKGLIKYLESFKNKDGYKEFHKSTWDSLYNQMEHILKTHYSLVAEKILYSLDNNENLVYKTAKLARLAFDCDLILYKKS